VQYANAQANLKRYQSLAAEKIASEKDLDDAVSAERSGKAAVLSAQAAIGVAEAAVNKAQLDLNFTKIVSPIDGIAGIAQAQVGDLVGPSQTGALTTVSTLDPIKVYYPISEQFYINHMKQFANASAGSDPPQALEHELILADGSVYPQKGKLYAVDRQVNNQTGTLRVEALFPNPGNRLRPGQFARVRVAIETKKGALLVPQQAVTELQGNYQVAVVGPDNRVDIRPVNAGDRVGSLWVIDQGLNPGERVVAEGIQKVKQGTLVNPKPFVPVTPAGQEPSLKPEDQPAAGKK
jgi:membrane fusion protein (multidrug efflux system)